MLIRGQLHKEPLSVPPLFGRDVASAQTVLPWTPRPNHSQNINFWGDEEEESVVRHIHNGAAGEKTSRTATARNVWKDFGEQRSCLFAPKFVCHTALSWELGWKKKLVLEMIQELSSCGRYRTNPQVHTKRRMQPDVRSCSNDIHPTSREKAINPTKEQPGTQFSKFQLKHFHVQRREVRRMRDYAWEIVHEVLHGLCMWLLCIGGCALSQLSHVEKFPGSECCGFWRVDQGVFISTRVHIWRHWEGNPRKKQKKFGLRPNFQNYT